MNSGSTLYRYLLGGTGGATRRSYPADGRALRIETVINASQRPRLSTPPAQPRQAADQSPCGQRSRVAGSTCRPGLCPCESSLRADRAPHRHRGGGIQLTPDDFPNIDVLADRLIAFESRYNTAARPFDWRFNRDDLNRLLTRIAA